MTKNIHLWIQKYRRREFWPGYVFDIPVYIYFLYLAARAKHLGFFSNVNPGMILSGGAGYNKYEDKKKFEEHIFPKTILIEKGNDSEYIEKEMKKEGIGYPCIAKPTLGRTGRDVKKIHTNKQLKNYLKHMDEDILIQEFIYDSLEFWIFYYHIPGEKYGHISGIVEKKFMFLEGNGKDTFEELVYKHPRAKYYYHQLEKDYPDKWESIINNGEQFQLNYIGNHCRWSVFYDVSDIISPQLEKVIDDISQKVDGFYFGRYDIKAKSVKALEQWQFKIIELNGMGSLPTHIYDPKHNVRNAYKTLFDHRKIAYRISKENKKNGYAFVEIKKIIRIIKKYGI